MEMVRAAIRCGAAISECAGVVCHHMATALDWLAQKLKEYSEEPMQVAQVQSDNAGVPSIRQEAELRAHDGLGIEKDVVVVEEQRPSAERLASPGRFYAVVKGTKVGLYQSWFVAANQVLNVPGSLQERFSSRREALQFMVRYFQTVGWNEDIIEYNEQAQEVYRYSQSEFVM